MNEREEERGCVCIGAVCAMHVWDALLSASRARDASVRLTSTVCTSNPPSRRLPTRHFLPVVARRLPLSLAALVSPSLVSFLLDSAAALCLGYGRP